MAVIYGRDLERSRIGELLDGARASRSSVLVLLGEAGVGKSALLEDAREQGEGVRVLRASGVESEAHLPFAALHQVVRPVLDLIDNLPRPQAAALRGALGLAEGAGDDRFLISLATLSLLAEAAEPQPLLCLIDDAHWLDEASADALVFAARRLEAEGIVMLFSARESPGLSSLGLSNQEIAERLVISPATAKTHVSRTMMKLHAHDRAQLVVIAYESGLVRAPQ